MRSDRRDDRQLGELDGPEPYLEVAVIHAGACSTLAGHEQCEGRVAGEADRACLRLEGRGAAYASVRERRLGAHGERSPRRRLQAHADQ